MSRPPEGLSELAYAWGQYEARGTNRLPINSEREVASFIASAIRAAKAEAWDEGRRAEQEYRARQDDADAAGQYVKINLPRNPYRRASQQACS